MRRCVDASMHSVPARRHAQTGFAAGLAPLEDRLYPAPPPSGCQPDLRLDEDLLPADLSVVTSYSGR
jgi:hypothetical protein